MRFITEEDLKVAYKKEPFTTYDTKAGERLTPGGRQFLLDKGIKILSDSAYNKNINKFKKENVEKADKISEAVENTLSEKIFINKVKTIEALFLVTAEELLDRDVFLAQQITILGKQFGNLGKDKDAQNHIRLSVKECEGINTKNLDKELGDCFEITEFHIQLKRGREIVILHRLRCTLRELEPVIIQLFGETEFSSETIGKVNICINTLSQMICSIFGGKECQRKS